MSETKCVQFGLELEGSGASVPSSPRSWKLSKGILCSEHALPGVRALCCGAEGAAGYNWAAMHRHLLCTIQGWNFAPAHTSAAPNVGPKARCSLICAHGQSVSQVLGGVA